MTAMLVQALLSHITRSFYLYFISRSFFCLGGVAVPTQPLSNSTFNGVVLAFSSLADELKSNITVAAVHDAVDERLGSDVLTQVSRCPIMSVLFPFLSLIPTVVFVFLVRFLQKTIDPWHFTTEI